MSTYQARTPSFIRGRDDQLVSDQWLSENIANSQEPAEIARHLRIMQAAFWGPGGDAPYHSYREACNHYLKTDREGHWPEPVRTAYETLRRWHGHMWNVGGD